MEETEKLVTTRLFKTYIFIYLALPGLICGTWGLYFSCVTRDLHADALAASGV